MDVVRRADHTVHVWLCSLGALQDPLRVPLLPGAFQDLLPGKTLGRVEPGVYRARSYYAFPPSLCCLGSTLRPNPGSLLGTSQRRNPWIPFKANTRPVFSLWVPDTGWCPLGVINLPTQAHSSHCSQVWVIVRPSPRCGPGGTEKSPHGPAAG